MTTSIPPEFQKDYTWDAIVFSDGATYVCEARRGEARRGDDATRVTMMALMATRGEREGFDVMHAREVHARDGMNGC